MSFRTVVIDKPCKLTYKNNYLVVRTSEEKMVFLGEIESIILNTSEVSLTAFLAAELVKRKIGLVFTDEYHNPVALLTPIYGAHNTSKRVQIQIAWKSETRAAVWEKIVREKIMNQTRVLRLFGLAEYMQLEEYANDIRENDASNREGHAAKVYFNSLFGNGFSRETDNQINAMLNYGYAIVLSAIAREITANGYFTQIGVFHRNEFNELNLACDFMEPFRPLVDEYAATHIGEKFGKAHKLALVDMLNMRVIWKKSEYSLYDAISLYCKSLFAALENNNPDNIEFCEKLCGTE